jgi:PhnB protein
MKNVNTYLVFEGNCRQAMEFYKKCLGGELYMMDYSQMPKQDGCVDLPKECKNWIMHSRITSKSFVLMASDTRPGLPIQQGNNFFVSINCDGIEESEKLFKALSDKGKIDMPLQETFFATRFAMITDQFGIKWMLNLEKSEK